MKVEILRSKEFLAREMVATSKNLQAELTFEVEPAALSPEMRELIITLNGRYPDTLSYIAYTKVGKIRRHGDSQFEGKLFFHADLNKEGLDPVLTTEYVVGKALAKLETEIAPALVQKAEEEAAELNAAIDEFLENTARQARDVESKLVVFDWNRRVDETHPRFAALYAEATRRQDEAKAAKKAAEAAKLDEEKLRAATIDEWVATNGTENQKGRHALRLLPKDEVLNAIRADLFLPLIDLPKYEKITCKEISCSCEHYAPECEFFAGAADEVGPADYDALAAVKKLLPGAAVELRKHAGYCKTCYQNDLDDGQVTRMSMLVTVSHGGHTFSREYGVTACEGAQAADIHDFGSGYSQTYEKKCECGRKVEVSTQKDDSPEYYTSVFVKCMCGKSVGFELPVN